MKNSNAAVRLLAAGAHAALGQTYGDELYVVHLDALVGILLEFGIRQDRFVQAGYLHDIVEDTAVTDDTLLALGIDPVVVRAVRFVTDEGGPDRTTRKARTYERVRRDVALGGEHVDIGLAVKWADRIANLRASVRDAPELLRMYRDEGEAFRDAYLPPTVAEDERWAAMVAEYDRLLGEAAV